MSAPQEVETGARLMPAFHKSEVLPAVAQDAETGEILMLGYVNDEALRLTLETGKATYFSRSRQKLWIKGETSGHVQRVEEVLTDCDQDAFIFKVRQEGAACHVGYRSCFYRRAPLNSSKTLEHVGGHKVFNPEDVYDSTEK